MSRSPDFCMLKPKSWSIANSNTSHSTPTVIAAQKLRIPIAQGGAA
ncbi:MAG: hypothetical protein ACLGIE_13275 [Alphaproteobacteria bacterium]